MKQFFLRLEERRRPHKIILGSLGAFLAISTLMLLGQWISFSLMIASFAGTVVLLFKGHTMSFSQPINVIGGHLTCITIGVLGNQFLPFNWLIVAICVGIAIAIMASLRITHPPAGANVAIAFHENLSYWAILFPVFAGTVVLIILSYLYHKYVNRVEYPLKK